MMMMFRISDLFEDLALVEFFTIVFTFPDEVLMH